MAQTTVELRHLMKTSNFKLFDFTYQFDDAAFKNKIEQAVIDHYYFAEIGQETPDHFKHVFKTRWLRMIDYYNKLHNTTLLSYNPLINHSMSEAMEQLSQSSNTQNTTSDSTQNTTADSTTDSTNTTTGDSHSFNDSTTKNSDYPQQAIAGGDFLSGESNTISDTNSEDSSKTTGKVTNDSTAKTTADNTSQMTGSGSTNTDYERTIEGLTGTTYQDLIMKERDTMLRITDMVIQELKPCFMLVY